MAQTVCTRELLMEDNLLTLAKSMKVAGIDEMRIIETLPCGKLAKEKSVLLSAEESNKLIKFHISCNRDASLPKVSVFSYFESPEQFGCGARLQHSYIDHRGNLYHCGFVPIRFGNVLETPLTELWEKMQDGIGAPRGTYLAKGCLDGIDYKAAYPVHIDAFMQYRNLGIKLISLHKAVRASKREGLFELLKQADHTWSIKYIKLMKAYSRYDHLARAQGIKTPITIIISNNTFSQVKKTANSLKQIMGNVEIVKIRAKSHFVCEE